jgi:hypothetical protein
MALRLFEPTLANVRADLRSMYVRDAEHGFRLDLIDLDDFVHGLRSALAKERQRIKELKAKYGVTPDGVEALAAFGEMPLAKASRAVPECGPDCYHDAGRRNVERRTDTRVGCTLFVARRYLHTQEKGSIK